MVGDKRRVPCVKCHACPGCAQLLWWCSLFCGRQVPLGSACAWRSPLSLVTLPVYAPCSARVRTSACMFCHAACAASCGYLFLGGREAGRTAPFTLTCGGAVVWCTPPSFPGYGPSLAHYHLRFVVLGLYWNVSAWMDGYSLHCATLCAAQRLDCGWRGCSVACARLCVKYCYCCCSAAARTRLHRVCVALWRVPVHTPPPLRLYGLVRKEGKKRMPSAVESLASPLTDMCACVCHMSRRVVVAGCTGAPYTHMHTVCVCVCLHGAPERWCWRVALCAHAAISSALVIAIGCHGLWLWLGTPLSLSGPQPGRGWRCCPSVDHHPPIHSTPIPGCCQRAEATQVGEVGALGGWCASAQLFMRRACALACCVSQVSVIF